APDPAGPRWSTRPAAPAAASGDAAPTSPAGQLLGQGSCPTGHQDGPADARWSTRPADHPAAPAVGAGGGAPGWAGGADWLGAGVPVQAHDAGAAVPGGGSGLAAADPEAEAEETLSGIGRVLVVPLVPIVAAWEAGRAAVRSAVAAVRA